MCWRSDITKCPLYIESHVGEGLGCVDDMLQPCMVDRGEMNFETAIMELARRGRRYPGMIEALNCPHLVQ